MTSSVSLSQTWGIEWTPRRVALSIFGSHLALLLAAHQVTAESTTNSTTTTTDEESLGACWERVRVEGPLALVEPRDQILFVAVLLLAFELLDFLSKNSGSKLWRYEESSPGWTGPVILKSSLLLHDDFENVYRMGSMEADTCTGKALG